jgi:hypothetical protein
MKTEGPIWLGLSDQVRSLRTYPEIGDIGQMVARSAYAQLRYSPLLLATILAGMAVTYLAPPLLAIFGRHPGNAVAAIAWALMIFAFLPILRFYHLSPLWAAALPLIAATYSAFTLNSVLEHWRGRGGTWKGRSQALRAK